jgi:iron complex outermembrane receptor protein
MERNIRKTNQRRVAMLAFYLFTAPLIATAQYSLSGAVKTAGAGEPLPGAHVVIENTFRAASTDLQGSFRFKNLPEGTYILRVSYIGFQTYKKEIRIDHDRVEDIMLELSPVMQDEVIVTATRAGEQSPVAYTQIEKKELSKINLAPDIPLLVESSPSAVATSDAGAGVGYTNLRIRGTDLTRINVTLDGVPLNDPESQGMWFVDLPDLAASIENIQIQRGVGTSSNGGSAFGATINFLTLKPTPEPFADISSSAGSFNTFRNSMMFGTGTINSRWNIEGRASWIISDGYIDNSASDLRSFFLSGTWMEKKSILRLHILGGKERTHLAWNGVPRDVLDTNRTYNGLGLYTDASGRIRYYDNETDNYNQDHYHLLWSRELSSSWILNTAFFYIRGFGYYEEYKEDRDFSDYGLAITDTSGQPVAGTSDMVVRKYLDNHYYGCTWSANYDSRKKIKANLGGGLSEYDGRHYGDIVNSFYLGTTEADFRWYRGKGIKKDLHAYLKLTYRPNSRIHLFGDVQYRHVNHDITGIDDDLRDVTQEHYFNFVNPKAGIFFDFAEKQQAYLSFALSNREPNRSNYTDWSPGTPVPVHETLRDLEAGYVFSGHTLSVDANLFWMDYKNQLVLTGQINDVGNPVMQNVPASYRAGVEVSCNALLLHRQVAWDAHATLSRNRIKDFADYVPDFGGAEVQYVVSGLGETDIAFSPAFTAGNRITWKPFKDVEYSLQSRYVGRQYIDNTSDRVHSLDPYLVHDLWISYLLHPKGMKSMGITVKICNVMNTEYESNAWVYRYYYGEYYEDSGYFPQAGIHFMAGLNLSF